MKFIEQKATLITENDPFRKIEIAGRTCYRSEDKITDDSAAKFVRGLIKSGHTAMVEHQVFSFRIIQTNENYMEYDRYIKWLSQCRYLHTTVECFGFPGTYATRTRVLVSGNVRAINERDYSDPLTRAIREKYPDLVWNNKKEKFPDIEAELVDIAFIDDLTENEILEHSYLTYEFVTNRAVTHELVRHRPCSFAQESTRYCGYNKDKFGGELTFIIPEGFNEWPKEFKEDYYRLLESVEKTYMKWVTAEDTPLMPQQARDILTNGIKTQIVVTANMREWNHGYKTRVPCSDQRKTERLSALWLTMTATNQIVSNGLLSV